MFDIERAGMGRLDLPQQMIHMILSQVPKNDLSHWVGRLVHRRLPAPIGPKTVEWFAKFYNINLDEAEKPLSEYHSIGELFTRRLKSGARPLGEGIVHPCDAVITAGGAIEESMLIQAKQHKFTLTEFLRSPHWAETFQNGAYLTYYLCPTDYHRVHMPFDAEIVWSSHVPGELWPVNAWSVENIAELFVQNERVIAVMKTSLGHIAMVMVAATNVGNISMSFDTQINTNRLGSERAVKERSYEPPVNLKKGDEFGVFHMGSTVVLIFEKGILAADICAELKGKHTQVGQSFS